MAATTDPSSHRILLFGGTFDPPHLAHARLPALAARRLDCGEILYVPAAINPLKNDADSTPAHHRLAMLLLAIADVPGARINTIELDRQGRSYTIDTLKALHRQHNAALVPQLLSSSKHAAHAARSKPQLSFHLLIGSDQALDFHRWKDWQEILTLATPAVMLRPPLDRQSFENKLRNQYEAHEAERWLSWTLRLPEMDITATDIRQRLRAGASVDGLLDPAVAEYIRANNLYQ